MIAPDVAPCGHERITPGCRLCSIAARDPRYAALFFGGDQAIPAGRDQKARGGPTRQQMHGLRPCARLGAATGELAGCVGCGGAATAPVRLCTLHGECTTDRRAEKRPPEGRRVPLPWCRTCADYVPAPPPDGAAQVVVTADGIGDHVLGLAAAAAWRRDNPGRHLAFVAKPRLHAWARLFDAYDELASAPDPARATVCDLSRRGATHYAEAVQALPLLPPAVRPLPDDALAWAEQYAGCVVLCPGAGYKRPNAPEWACNDRVWLPSHWLFLERLLGESGRRVVAIDSDAKRIAQHAEPLANLPPARVAALVRAARCVVSNESGMAHFAGALGAACVVLSGPLDARLIHGVWRQTRALNGPLGCSGCRWKGPHFRPHCATLCASLQAIQPGDVMRAIGEIAPPPVNPADETAKRVRLVNFEGGRDFEEGSERRCLTPHEDAVWRRYCETHWHVVRRMEWIDWSEVVRGAGGVAAVGRAEAQAPDPRGRLAEMLARVDGAAWSGRHRIFREALARLNGRERPLIVETGCQRQEDDVGAGMSTTIFGLWAQANGGRVVSIDNDRSHVELARRVTEGLPVRVECLDSRVALGSWEGPKIDLLYLDSLDAYVEGHAEHCLAEVRTALPELKPDSLVLIDDTFNDGGEWKGKGALAVPWLLGEGWGLLAMGHQTLLRRG
jgi:hypothetical protein